MKYGVIDVGSNSVRLMISQNGQTLYKTVKTTRLAEGMGKSLLLQSEAVERTARAVSFFVEQAKNENANQIFVFATAAVRSAKNSKVFIDAVNKLCGVDVQVVSGETEADLGRIGALGYADGGIIDVGGASTEILVVLNGLTVYSNSLDIGAVKIKDSCGQDKGCALQYISSFIDKIGRVPKTQFYSIGGTATSIAAMLQELEPYDPTKTHGYIVDKNSLSKLVDKLFSLSVEERKGLKGLQPERAEVIAGGALMLLIVMGKIGIEEIIVSESDNLEGFLLLKRGNYEKTN